MQKDLKALMADQKRVYAAVNESSAGKALGELSALPDKKYLEIPNILQAQVFVLLWVLLYYFGVSFLELSPRT